jgi:hypothetical protein
MNRLTDAYFKGARNAGSHFPPQTGSTPEDQNRWLDRASMVTVESDGLCDLQFDNLAYSPYLWASVYRGE